MVKIIEINPLENYKLHLKFDDGVEGDIDLSSLVGKGVFSSFADVKFFNNVKIGDAGAPTWENEIDIDPLNQYLKITGKTFEEYLISIKKQA